MQSINLKSQLFGFDSIIKTLIISHLYMYFELYILDLFFQNLY